MREEVVGYVYPIFGETFRVLDQLRERTPTDRRQVAAKMHSLLADYYTAGREKPTESNRREPLSEDQLIHAAMVYWVDEMFSCQGSTWAGDWRNHSLEQGYWPGTETERGAAFYDLADQAAHRNLTDAVEVFILCLLLGFKGTPPHQRERGDVLTELRSHVPEPPRDDAAPNVSQSPVAASRHKSGFQRMVLIGVIAALGWLALSVTVFIHLWLRK